MAAQSLQVLGRLAAGVAHDFNNVLMAILGNADAILRNPAVPEQAREDAAEIRKAGERGARLAQQVLRYGAPGCDSEEDLDVSEVVRESERMLRRLAGSAVKLELTLAPALPRVRADRSRVEQVVLNLVLNARDAMPDGGHVLVGTSPLWIGAADAERLGLPPGGYVSLWVEDEGVGMEGEVLQHAFEPFFTTKPRGGTGLGLSTVHRIAREAGGDVLVISEPGLGSRFDVLFPVAARMGTGF
jgi:two-component system cell cycle sensor histidine kinase/response regulator CckA